VKIDRSEHGELPLLAGSGTFVTSNGRFGILTAAHVLEILPTEGRIGLVLPGVPETQVQYPTIEIEHTDRLAWGSSSSGDRGPDLGVLRISAADARRFEAFASFYDLEKRRDRALTSPPRPDAGGWFLCGTVGCWTEDLLPESGLINVKGFARLCGGVATPRWRDGGSYDYYELDVQNDRIGVPATFQGVSGGGLFQLLFREAAGQLEIVETILSGVAFFESGVREGMRVITCHGRRSIYAHLLSHIR
jgi:hypothetical protein